jgi:integrase
LNIEDYESVKKWFLNADFESSTKKEYVQWLKTWCKFTDKTPDELARCEDINKERGIIAVALKEKGLRILTITQRLTVLNSFWAYNGRQVTDTYGGVPDYIRKDIERAVKAPKSKGFFRKNKA